MRNETKLYWRLFRIRFLTMFLVLVYGIFRIIFEIIFTGVRIVLFIPTIFSDDFYDSSIEILSTDLDDAMEIRFNS